MTKALPSLQSCPVPFAGPPPGHWPGKLALRNVYAAAQHGIFPSFPLFGEKAIQAMASQQSQSGFAPQTQASLNFSQDHSYNFIDYGTQDFNSEQDYPQFTGLSQVGLLFGFLTILRMTTLQQRSSH